MTDFFAMHGYGIYIWLSYLCAFIFLFVQWFIPFQKWRRYQQQLRSKSL